MVLNGADGLATNNKDDDAIKEIGEKIGGFLGAHGHEITAQASEAVGHAVEAGSHALETGKQAAEVLHALETGTAAKTAAEVA